jgi:hypothetical protein
MIAGSLVSALLAFISVPLVFIPMIVYLIIVNQLVVPTTSTYRNPDTIALTYTWRIYCMIAAIMCSFISLLFCQADSPVVASNNNNIRVSVVNRNNNRSVNTSPSSVPPEAMVRV